MLLRLSTQRTPAEFSRGPDCCSLSPEGEIAGQDIWLRGVYQGSAARLPYGLDGSSYTDTSAAVELKFGKWKGARLAVFCCGPNGGVGDIDFIHYELRE